MLRVGQCCSVRTTEMVHTVPGALVSCAQPDGKMSSFCSPIRCSTAERPSATVKSRLYTCTMSYTRVATGTAFVSMQILQFHGEAVTPRLSVQARSSTADCCGMEKSSRLVASQRLRSPTTTTGRPRSSHRGRAGVRLLTLPSSRRLRAAAPSTALACHHAVTAAAPPSRAHAPPIVYRSEHLGNRLALPTGATKHPCHPLHEHCSFPAHTDAARPRQPRLQQLFMPS